MSESTVKIHLVSMHDDSGYKAVVKNTKEAERAVTESLKRQSESRKAAVEESAAANSAALDDIRATAKGAETAMKAASGNIMSATKSIVEMGGASQKLGAILAKLGAVRLGVIGALVGIGKAFYDWVKKTKEECDQLVHESRMKRLEVMGRCIDRIGKSFNAAAHEAMELRRAEDAVLSAQREFEDAQMRLAKANALNKVSSGDEEARHQIELKNKELAKEVEYRRKIEDEEKKIRRLYEDDERLSGKSQELQDRLNDIKREIGEYESKDERNANDNKELERLYGLRKTLTSDLNETLTKMGDNSTSRHNAEVRAQSLRETLKVEKQILQAEEEDRVSSKAEAEQKALDEQLEREREAKEAAERAEEERYLRALEHEEREREAANERMMREWERAEAEKERIRRDNNRRAIDEELKDYQGELQQRQRMLQDANARLSYAQRASSQAWSWFRDKDSLKSALEERKADADAEKEFQRQFSRLKAMRGDWRTANAYGSGGMRSLTLDEEAVRQVALSREEEANAQKAVTDCRDSLAWIREHLEQVEAMKE